MATTTATEIGAGRASVMQRLVVALPVPPAAARILAALPRRGLNARWVPAEELHITLRFLGDVAAGRVPDVIDALSRVRRPSFSVEVDGLGSFGDTSPRSPVRARCQHA